MIRLVVLAIVLELRRVLRELLRSLTLRAA